MNNHEKYNFDTDNVLNILKKSLNKLSNYLEIYKYINFVINDIKKII